MASIYANAYATIVAAQGIDANHCLRGIKGVSKPRDYLQRVYNIGDNFKIVELQRDKAECKGSLWATRAWTYQESLCSTRKIVFCDNTVSWACASDWYENKFNPGNNDELLMDLIVGTPAIPAALELSFPTLKVIWSLSAGTI